MSPFISLSLHSLPSPSAISEIFLFFFVRVWFRFVFFDLFVFPFFLYFLPSSFCSFFSITVSFFSTAFDLFLFPLLYFSLTDLLLFLIFRSPNYFSFVPLPTWLYPPPPFHFHIYTYFYLFFHLFVFFCFSFFFLYISISSLSSCFVLLFLPFLLFITAHRLFSFFHLFVFSCFFYLCQLSLIHIPPFLITPPPPPWCPLINPQPPTCKS